MDEYPDTDGHFRRYLSERHCGRIRDFSLGDREDRQILVKTLRRRFPEEVHQTNIVLIDCCAFRDPARSALRNHWGVHPTTLSKILNHHKFPGLLLDLVERVIRFADKDPKTRILIGLICSKAHHRSVACSYLMQVIHTALMCRLFTPVGCRCAFDGIRAREACGELEQSCRECCLDITASKAKCDIHVCACNSCDSSSW